MTKRLNTNSITNELEGSAFFPSKATPPSASPTRPPIGDAAKPARVIIQTREPEQLVPERANAPTAQRSNGKRIITRNSFEIYEDQMGALRTLSYQEKNGRATWQYEWHGQGSNRQLSSEEDLRKITRIVLPFVRTPELSNERRHDASNASMQVPFSMLRLSVYRKLYRSIAVGDYTCCDRGADKTAAVFLERGFANKNGLVYRTKRPSDRDQLPPSGG